MGYSLWGHKKVGHDLATKLGPTVETGLLRVYNGAWGSVLSRLPRWITATFGYSTGG